MRIPLRRPPGAARHKGRVGRRRPRRPGSRRRRPGQVAAGVLRSESGHAAPGAEHGRRGGIGQGRHRYWRGLPLHALHHGGVGAGRAQVDGRQR